jgi:hypothetical protein
VTRTGHIRRKSSTSRQIRKRLQGKTERFELSSSPDTLSVYCPRASKWQLEIKFDGYCGIGTRPTAACIWPHATERISRSPMLSKQSCRRASKRATLARSLVFDM